MAFFTSKKAFCDSRQICKIDLVCLSLASRSALGTMHVEINTVPQLHNTDTRGGCSVAAG